MKIEILGGDGTATTCRELNDLVGQISRFKGKGDATQESCVPRERGEEGCWGVGVLGCWGAGVLGCWEEGGIVIFFSILISSQLDAEELRLDREVLKFFL